MFSSDIVELMVKIPCQEIGMDQVARQLSLEVKASIETSMLDLFDNAKDKEYMAKSWQEISRDELEWLKQNKELLKDILKDSWTEQKYQQQIHEWQYQELICKREYERFKSTREQEEGQIKQLQLFEENDDDTNVWDLLEE